MALPTFYAHWNASLSGCLKAHANVCINDETLALPHTGAYIQPLPLHPEAPTLCIGIMSGTSLDGIDVAGARFSVDAASLDVSQEQVLHYEAPYPSALKARILALQMGQPVTLTELLALDALLAETYAEALAVALVQWGINPMDVAIVSNHGQTVYHQLASEVGLGRMTLQLGNLSRLAERIRGICPYARVLGHFREGDTAHGGQGAPLVPFYDAVLLGQPEEAFIAHNLGGISNVTVIPPRHGHAPFDVFAFDTGVANIWMDAVCHHYYGVAYDAGGHLAREGSRIESLFQALVAHPFHRLPPPKSTGRDEYHWEGLRQHIAHHRDSTHTRGDVLYTVMDATAYAMAEAYHTYIFPRLESVPLKGILFSGGGAENLTLLDAFSRHLESLTHRPCPPLLSPEALNIPNKAKEALAFALLGWAKTLHLPNNLPACTGSRAYTSLGVCG
jgi:anhydro-N-acetylmuramic acid kinase